MEEKTTQQVTEENRQKLLEKDNQEKQTVKKTITQTERERNFGRIRLFKIRSKKTRNYVKIMGFSLMLGVLYLAYDVAQMSLIDMGYGSIQLKMMFSLGPDLVGFLLIACFGPMLKRRKFIRFAQIPIFCNPFNSFC